MTNTESLEAGCAPIVDEPDRYHLLRLMAEFAQLMGCTEIKARLAGFPMPAMLPGTLEDHRPDLTCRQPDRRRTPLILETVTEANLRSQGSKSRWTLLASAASLQGAELHFAVPCWLMGGLLGEVKLRNLLARWMIGPTRIWAV